MEETTYIIIPTVRNLDFLPKWREEFQNIIGIIVEDHKTKQIKTPKNIFKKVYHYTWDDIDRDLGRKRWIIPRKTSAVRSYGFYKAYQLGAEVIITIDDDCLPFEKDFVKKHIRNLQTHIPSRWFPTNPFHKYWYTRGFPYGNNRSDIPVVLSHGLWTKNLDFDAPTHLFNLNYEHNYNFEYNYFIPKNYYYPLCIMNVAFRREITPLLYMLLMGFDHKQKYLGIERFDDIWAGIMSKKILDHLNLGVISGSPLIEHRKASNPFENLSKEARGIKFNESFWQMIDEVKLTQKNVLGCYEELIIKTSFPKDPYFALLKKAVLQWLMLFKKESF